MWIVILNFCLFILLIGFLFYGLGKWTNLITEYEDGSETIEKTESENYEDGKNIIDGRFIRLPLWVLLTGILISQIIGLIKYMLGY